MWSARQKDSVGAVAECQSQVDLAQYLDASRALILSAHLEQDQAVKIVLAHLPITKRAAATM